MIKVYYNAFRLDNQDKDPFNPRMMFRSSKDQGIVYILGVIDYLETWNVKKQSERWYKSLFANRDGISSQDPHFYSERFRENLINQIFP